METKNHHTPAPWFVDKWTNPGTDDLLLIRNKDKELRREGLTIASISISPGHPIGTEAEANAEIISIAPGMYGTLKSTHHTLELLLGRLRNMRSESKNIYLLDTMIKDTTQAIANIENTI